MTLSNKDKPATLSVGAINNLMAKHQTTVDVQTQGQLAALTQWLMKQLSMNEEEASKFCQQYKSELLPYLAEDPAILADVVNRIRNS